MAAYFKEYRARPGMKERQRANHRFARTGLTPEQQRALWDAQGGQCVCGDDLVDGKWTHLDHDHDTGEARGFLCHNCNLAVGHLKDSPDRARKLAAYLEKHAPKLRLVKP
jgi:hypothetical protein